MHIGISTSVIQGGKTGIAQYVFALCRALLEWREHDYTLFVLEEDVPLFKFAAGKMRLAVVPERFRAPVRDVLWHQTGLPKLARALRLDVLHVPSYRRMLLPRPCPVVATIHDLAQFHIAKKYSWARMIYGRKVAPFLARRQDQIVAISQNTADDINRFLRVPSDRLTVVYNGLDHGRFCPGDTVEAKAQISRRFNLEKPFFLYIARLEHPGKNHTRLIEAFNQYKSATTSPWQLVLAGGDWHGAEHIHQAAQNSPYAQDIRFLGFVPDDIVPDLYRGADAFVYPSLYEGFGMPPTEAMACGCPVICSDRGSLGEVIGEAAARIDPERVDVMAEQLRVVSSDAGKREQMKQLGLIQALRFDWKHTAEKMLGVYQRAVGMEKTPNSNIQTSEKLPASNSKRSDAPDTIQRDFAAPGSRLV